MATEQNYKSRDEQDLKSMKKKMNKLRSIKLSKSPSSKPSTRRPKLKPGNIVIDFEPTDTESLSTPFSTSSLKSDISQKSAPLLSRRSSFKKATRTLIRTSSMKQKSSVAEFGHSSTNNVDNRIRRKSTQSKSNSGKAFTRKASLRPLRISLSAKAKRVPMEKHEVIAHSEEGVEKATCSSTLKDSKFDSTLHVQHGECEVNPDMKVCPFSYCSLHGHRHRSAPPLQRLISIRRRLLRNERGKAAQDRAKFREKHSRKAKNNGLISPVEGGEEKSLVEESVYSDSENVFESEMCAEGVGNSESLEKIALRRREKGSSESLSELDGEEVDGIKEEKENLDTKHGVLQRTELKDQKYRKIWRLMYKHTVGGAENPNSKNAEQDVFESEMCAEGVGNSESLEKIALRRREKGSSESLSELDGEEVDGEEVDGIKKEKENLDTKHGVLQRTELKDQKYRKMWRLMYKHTVGGAENPNSKNAEQEVGESKAIIDETVTESYQINAIKLVQQAFDEILLPEIQEFTPKAAKTTETKVSNSWSRLKKIFILKRFVKAMEEVKRISRAIPRYLPLEPEAEAERVNLRRQTSEERKNASEWMLDFALQKVVSKLEPAQRQRVAMLVMAFETVLPQQDSLSPSISLNDFSRGESARSESCLVSENGEKACAEADEEENVSSTFAEKSLFQGLVSNFRQDRRTNSGETLSSFHEALDNGKAQVVKEAVNSPYKAEKPESPVIVIKPIQRSVTVREEDAQFGKQSYMKLWGFVYMHMVSSIDEPDAKTMENAVKTQASSDKIDTTKNEKAILRRIEAIKLIEKAIDEIILPENEETQQDGQSTSGTGCDDEPPAEKISLAKAGFSSKLSALGERVLTEPSVSGETAQFSSEPSIPSEQAQFSTKPSASGETAQFSTESSISSRTVQFSTKPSVSGEIAQLSSDSSVSSEKAQFRAKPSVSGQRAQLSSESSVSAEKAQLSLDPAISDERAQFRTELGTSTAESAKEARESPSKKPISRNWSNLKKMILLRRFIKALEGSKGFNPRPPTFLEPEAISEAEKVNLRRQEMEERKRAEEWMVDHALQQAVARLTPARKRKVQLLVEAFETVTPSGRA